VEMDLADDQLAGLGAEWFGAGASSMHTELPEHAGFPAGAPAPHVVQVPTTSLPEVATWAPWVMGGPTEAPTPEQAAPRKRRRPQKNAAPRKRSSQKAAPPVGDFDSRVSFETEVGVFVRSGLRAVLKIPHLICFIVPRCTKKPTCCVCCSWSRTSSRKRYELACNLHSFGVLTVVLFQGDDKDTESELVQAALTKAGYAARQDYVRSNGDCLYDSLADQLFSESDRKTWHIPAHRISRSRLVRDLIADQILGKEGSNQPGPMASLKPYMLKAEIKDLRRDEGWGCHPVLVAAATLFKRNIRIYRSHGKITIAPLSSSAREAADKKPALLLCHWFERHFGSLAPLAHTEAGGGAGAGAGAGSGGGGACDDGDTVMKQL
jgi:hypothetical protein